MNNKVKIAVFFVMMGAGVIGLLWAPLFAGLPGAEENIIPREASRWHIGKGVEYNPTLHYTINTDTMKFSAKIEFLSSQPEKQIRVEITHPQSGTQITQAVPISSAYTFGEVSDDARPYFTTLDQTIFSIRDLALEDRYLVKKAVWGTMFIGAITQEITVTEHGQTSFRFGSADAFTISYDIGDKQTKFWIVDNLPLPVKAEVYDIEGNLQYTYELTSLTAPSTPGFG
ncbi:MAG: hypothetical protein ACT4N1_04505 [Nitrososphaerota archaeon]